MVITFVNNRWYDNVTNTIVDRTYTIAFGGIGSGPNSNVLLTQVNGWYAIVHGYFRQTNAFTGTNMIIELSGPTYKGDGVFPSSMAGIWVNNDQWISATVPGGTFPTTEWNIDLSSGWGNSYTQNVTYPWRLKIPYGWTRNGDGSYTCVFKWTVGASTGYLTESFGYLGHNTSCDNGGCSIPIDGCCVGYVYSLLTIHHISLHS
jgi:hypothetical protein